MDDEKHVPDRWCCNVETPSVELCSCRKDKNVVAFCRTKICPTRNAGDWDADIVEVGRTVLTDTVKRRDC